QRGTIGLLDEFCHREGFAGTRHAQQHLVLFACFQAAIELLNCCRLVSARLIVAVQLKFHARVLLAVHRPLPKPSLYSDTCALPLLLGNQRRLRVPRVDCRCNNDQSDAATVESKWTVSREWR